MSRYMEPAARVRFIEGVVERLSQVPGVSAAASGAYAPMTIDARDADGLRLTASRCRRRAPSRSRSICPPGRPTPR